MPPIAMSLFLEKPKPQETERRENIFLLSCQEGKVENLMEIYGVGWNPEDFNQILQGMWITWALVKFWGGAQKSSSG